MNIGCSTWDQVVYRVMQTNQIYIGEQLTIERREVENSIAIVTDHSTEKFTPGLAVKFLKENFKFGKGWFTIRPDYPNNF